MSNRKKPSSTTKRAVDQAESKEEDTKPETETTEAEHKDVVETDNKEEPTSEPASKKRKTSASNTAGDRPHSKRATRSSAKTGSSHEPKAIIEFLLSDEAFKLLDQLQTVDADGFKFPRDRWAYYVSYD